MELFIFKPFNAAQLYAFGVRVREGVDASVVCGGEMASGEEGGASAVFEEHVPGAADAGTAGDGNLCAEGGGLGSDARAGVL